MTTTSTIFQTPAAKPSKAALITGWVLSILPALFMGGGGIAMMFNPAKVKESMVEHGFTNPDQATWIILTLEVVCSVIYLIPQTAVLGAILLTGYLGGAICTHLRIGELPQMTPAIVMGVMVWLGLYLRDLRVRALAPLRHV